MESFRNDGCLSDEGLHALIAGQLDELGRLEAAEHLAYCDKCTDRYTALLTADALSDPPRSVRRTVMGTIWVRLMQSTCGRAAVAGVAAVLALTIWRTGALTLSPTTAATCRPSCPPFRSLCRKSSPRSSCRRSWAGRWTPAPERTSTPAFPLRWKAC